ncbi:MAG TPA: 1,2-phenylacetyl-CoA epoxidase subunit PaaE [Chitinophagaceae bacterium]|nr:1,2-phenylacetyl-CoA epoxidase subunit PaaE [Chitinophagaceae bacterium]
MSLHFHTLTIKDIRKETEDCISVSFDIPESLEESFRFEQGQNITVRKVIDGEELRRNYSICTSPNDQELRVAIKAMPFGRFSTWANAGLKKGDTLEVMPPTGKFNTRLDPRAHKNYLAFAAGSGITPVISIIKTTLKTEPGSSFTLIYGNRNRRSIIFREELENLKNKYMNRLQLVHILSREEPESSILFGRIDGNKCSELGRHLVNMKDFDEVFICGPEQMIFSVRDYLKENGFPEEHIHFELFTTPTQTRQNNQTRIPESSEAQELSRIQVKIDGIVTSFELPIQGDTILNAALRHGADLPYACKGGMCATCKAKLIEGEVEMDVNYALEKDEVAAGFILTCQSHPLTASVFVDYDSR